MSEALHEPITTDDSFPAGISSEAARYDGSRTPADKQLLIWQLHEREARSATDIARILGMNPYTVKAVIAAKDTLVTDARMLLKANSLEFAHNAIEASKEAAKKGKIEGISAMLDRLGVTEPPKSGAQMSVGVQVILNGGAAPSELSRAKVAETSEGAVIQAQSEASLISPVMTMSDTPQHAVSQALTDSTLTITQDRQDTSAGSAAPGGATV